MFSQAVFAASKVVVINPGHSIGYDSGTYNSATGISEAEVNQKLAGKLADRLMKKGYTVYITHTTDNTYKNIRLGTQEQGSHLKSACDLANSKKPDLVISLHHNAGGNASGYELYWSSYRDYDKSGVYEVGGLWGNGDKAFRDKTPSAEAKNSQLFAQKIQEAFKGSKLPYRFTLERDDYFPAHAKAPCVLYEGGYISNNTESKYLNSTAYYDDASQRLMNAVVSFLGTPESTPIAKPTISSVTSSFSGDSTTDTVIKFTVKGVAIKDSTVVNVLFPIWSDKNGQDDIKWYQGKNEGNGNWSVTFDTKNHKNDIGKYNVHIYVENPKGQKTIVYARQFEVKAAPKSYTVTKVSETKAEAKITGYNDTEFKAAVWATTGGQDDIVWYKLSKQSDGSFKVVFDIAKHKNQTGTYNIHFYYKSKGIIGGTTVVLNGNKTSSSTQSPVCTISESSNGSFTVKISNVSGYKNIKVPIWSANKGQDDIKWYTAKRSGSTYSVTVNIRDHKNDTGMYNVHVYGESSSGSLKLLRGLTTNVKGMSASTFTVSSPSKNTFTINLSGLNAPNGCKEVLFPTWSETGGQDDISWYKASKTSSGYKFTVDIRKHKGGDVGIYNVHAYGRDNNGKLTILGTKQVTVPKITAKALTVEDLGSGKFKATVQGITAPNGLKKVSIPVWSEANGQDDIKWYQASKSGSNYVVTVDIKNHKNNEGKYNVHVYATDSNNKQVFLTGTSKQIQLKKPEPTPTPTPASVPKQTEQKPAVQNDTAAISQARVDANESIMGMSSVTAAQLKALYESKATAGYPQYYVDRGVNLDTFIQIYMEEAKAEGVKADIAFAQAMHETAWLAYGGDVKIEQFNFAGLGATGGGVTGENFSSYGDNATGIRMGIRAHIQHLKAYASTENLKNECVDPRFKYVSRGKASTIGALTGTWATDKAYSQKIITILNEIKE